MVVSALPRGREHRRRVWFGCIELEMPMRHPHRDVQSVVRRHPSKEIKKAWPKEWKKKQTRVMPPEPKGQPPGKSEWSDQQFQTHSLWTRHWAGKWGPRMTGLLSLPLDLIVLLPCVWSLPPLAPSVLRFSSFSPKFSWNAKSWPKSQRAWQGTQSCWLSLCLTNHHWHGAWLPTAKSCPHPFLGLTKTSCSQTRYNPTGLVSNQAQRPTLPPTAPP